MEKRRMGLVLGSGGVDRTELWPLGWLVVTDLAAWSGNNGASQAGALVT